MTGCGRVRLHDVPPADSERWRRVRTSTRPRRQPQESGSGTELDLT